MEVKEPNQKYLANQIGQGSSGWQSIKLGTVASFRTGPFGSALHKSDYVLGGVPVVNPMQIEDGRIKPTERMSVTEDAAEQLAEFRLKSGDVVIGRRGEMGRCAFVSDHQERWLCGTGSMIVRPGAKVDGRFLQRVLSSNQVVRAIENSSVGTTMINLNQRTLADLELHIPVNLEEQSAIARSLNDGDALIDSLEQLLTKKRLIKEGAMQELLAGKRRLPGFESEWTPVSMRELIAIPATYGIVTAGAFVQQGVRMLRSGDISNGRINLDLPMVTAEKSDEYSRTRLRQGDVVIALVGYPGESAQIPEELIGSNISRAVGLLRPNSKVHGEFLAHLLNSPLGRRMVLAPSAGSAQQVVNLAALNKLSLQIPEPDEQKAIAAVLTSMDENITAIEDRLKKARALKQAMAQALLTGRIRLVEPTT